MRRAITIGWVTVSLALAGPAWGGIFEIEVPADVEPEDVLNPTAEMKEKLNALLRDEISKNKAAAELGAVAFTKNGEIITRDVERDGTDDWSDNRLGFEPAQTPENQFLWPQYEGSWDAARWHLREVGEPAYDGVYALAEDVYGYPFWTGEVAVEWDETLPVEGYYNATYDTIYIQSWRNWENYLRQDPDDWPFHDDAAVLTRCMLQAFHGGRPCYWDHFDSMRRAAWIAIHNRLGYDGYELGFNDLYHDDQREDRPYYKCLDNYNTEDLGTRLHYWGDVNSDIDDRIKYWRYGAAGYCWWKVYRKQPGFIYNFNELSYHYGFGILRFIYSFWQSAAEEADNGTYIEARPFAEWFARQPILQNDHWCDDICALALDRTTARVLAYLRYKDGETGEEYEFGRSGVGVVVEKDDWEGENLRYTGVVTNEGGYAEWDFPIDKPDEGIRVTARLDLGAGPITDSRWGIDSDAAYEDDALYGVVSDAFNGGGTITIKKGGVEQATVPVVKKAFRWTPDIPPGPGEYELVYTPPRGGGVRLTSSQLVLKDGANYFSDRYYLAESYAPDLNGNDIPDAEEQDLAVKFVPQIQMHWGNRLIPSKVGLMLDPGRGPLVKYVFDQAGGKVGTIPFWPTEEYPMEEIFKDTYPWPTQEPPFIVEWKLVFGPNYGEIDPPYWINTYEDIVNSHPEYLEPTLYYNIFKDLGKPVIQYWAYYPFNNWANDHEGDWEHINVKLSSADVTRAAVVEALYYFHKKYAVRTGAAAPVIDDTHPLVYVGGECCAFPDWGQESGGNYWHLGEFSNVWEAFNEKLNDGGPIIDWRWFSDPDHTYERLVRNDRGTNLWWSQFPYGWGRQKEDIKVFSYLRQESPNSPLNHHCFEVYKHEDYTEYGKDTGARPIPPLAGPGDPAPPSDAAPFGPPVASVGAFPSVGDYLPPAAGDYPSPAALAPESAGADVPGADLPPNDAPALTSSDNPGGDWLSPGAAAAPLGRSGPLAAAAPATPLACKPNPVTVSATVSFNLEVPGRVHLAVYDLSGRRVATLADGPYAAGNHVAYWRADVPTGVYIYRLQAGDKVAVKKVVVAK